MVAAVTVGLLLTALRFRAAAEQPRGQGGHQVEHASSASPSASESLPGITAARREHFRGVGRHRRTTVPPPPGALTTTDASCSTWDHRARAGQGVNIIPGNPNIVHHVIVSPGAGIPGGQSPGTGMPRMPGDGWTCFGAPIEASEVAISTSRDWVGAWPRAVASAMSEDVGIPLEAGTQVVVQMHFNTLTGGGRRHSLVGCDCPRRPGRPRRPSPPCCCPRRWSCPVGWGTPRARCATERRFIDDAKTRFRGDGDGRRPPRPVGGDPIGDTQQCTCSVREPMVIFVRPLATCTCSAGRSPSMSTIRAPRRPSDPRRPGLRLRRPGPARAE